MEDMPMTNNQNNNAGKTITIPAFSDRARKLSVLAIGVLSVFLIFTLIFAPFIQLPFSMNSETKRKARYAR